MTASDATQADGAAETSGAVVGAADPAQTGERLVSLDFIRGIAVLGILFANIVAFSYPMLAYSWPKALEGADELPNKLVWLFQLVVIDGKMRGLFTLLFGAGMMVFLERAWARGASRWLQVRRLLLLTLFGLAHFYLLFWGDILFLYGIAGLASLLLVNWSPATQLKVGIVGYVAGGLLFSLSLAIPMGLEMAAASSGETPAMFAAMAEAWDKRIALSATELAIYRTGSFSSELTFVLEHRSSQLAQYPFIALFETVPLMLIGMACYRYRLFSGGIAPDKIRRWSWIGIGVGVTISLALGLWVMANEWPPYMTEFVFSGASQIPRLPIVLGMAGLMVLAAPGAAAGWLGSRVIAAGRMAFSNYILTSVVMMLVFRSWAGGLYAQLDRVELLLVVFLGWCIMLIWSKPWLARFRYGPLEWLWRCLTYGRRFALTR